MLLRRINPATRYPADPRAVFILSLCVVAGLPLLLGKVEPGSLEQLLPGWAILTWGACLVVGSSLALGGMSRQTPTGIVAEQIGSVIVGFATIFYATAILLVVGIDGTFSAAIIIGWGLSCFWRWGQLQSLLHNTQKIVDEARGE